MISADPYMFYDFKKKIMELKVYWNCTEVNFLEIISVLLPLLKSTGLVFIDPSSLSADPGCYFRIKYIT